jgi:Na+/H+ antiporter NhaC
MPLAMIFFIVFFFIGFVIKMSGKGLKQGERRDFTLLIIIMGLILLLLATKGAEFIGNFMPGFEEQGNNILVVAGIIFIAVIFLAAYKMSNKE